MAKGTSRRGGMIRTVGSFALGATAGSLGALLFAPASGRVTRKRIGRQFRSLQHATNRQLAQTSRLIVKKADGLREAAVDQLNHAKEWVTYRMGNGHTRRATRQRAAHHA